MTDDVFSRMTPEELDKVRAVMNPPVFTIGNILIWIALALMAAGFVVGRWWFYGWLFDHAPRWVSIFIAGA
jgi:hypothetical protein